MKRHFNALKLKNINVVNREETTEFSVLIFLGLITFTGFIAPFIHVFYNKSDAPGIFGFKNMSGFLFAIGFPILSVASGVLFYFVSRKFTGLLSRAFGIIAFLFAYVGVFFLTWAFIPSIQDFAPVYYYLSIIGIAFAITIALLLFSKYIFGLIKKIEKIDNLEDQSRYKGISMLLAFLEEMHREGEVTPEMYLTIIASIEEDYKDIKRKIEEDDAKNILYDYIAKFS